MPSPAAFKSLKVLDFDYKYLDSGAPASPNYTTWVLIHGMGFNGAVLEKLLPLAHAHNLRIVSVYRRGYAPSSGFQDHELTGIGFGKTIEEAEPFYRAQGVEIATFLVNFATEQGIPLADPNSATGGIALIGWSLGGVHATALLAYLDDLSEDTCSTLQKYLHTVLFHDANAAVLGITNPERHNIDLWFKTDDRERLDAFFDWAAAHYTHKNVASGNLDDIEFNVPSDIPSSLSELSYEQRAEYTDLQAFSVAGCDGKLLFCHSTAFAALTKRALFNKALAEKLPNVRVRFMSSGTSAGILIWTVWTLRKYVENPTEGPYGSDAEKARDIKFITQTEGNHFIFWEDPEKAIQQYSAAINL